MAYYDSFKLTNETIRELFRRIFRYSWYQNVEGNFYAFNEFSIPSLPVIKNLAEDEDELIATVYSANNVTWDSTGWQTARGSIGAFRYGVNFERPTGNNPHVCLLRYKTYTEKYSKADTVDGWLMLSNKSTGDVVIKRRWHSGSSLLKENSIEHKYNITGEYRNATFTGTEPPVELGIGIFGNTDDMILASTSRVNLYGLATNRGMSAEDLTNLETIYDGVGVDYLGVDSTTEATASPTAIYYALPSMAGNRAYGSQIVILEKAPDWIPVFDIDQTEDIIKFLKYGDDSGRKNVFDSNNPEEKIITDYKTNFRVFLSAYENDRTKTHYTIVAYNSQYINGDDFNAEYEMNVYEGRQTGQPLAKLGSAKDKKYPTLSYYNKLTPGVLYTNFMNFQDTTNEVGSDEKSSGYFGVTFTGKENSAVKATVGSVTWSQSADGSGQQLTKTNIVDGYRYTAPSGEYLEVIFRAIDLKDLNDGYAGDPDNEDDQTGTDADFIAGGGYNTFAIDSAQFKSINDALWSTDWSTVFRSNTIDPIKCVIGCKSIPFNANASAIGEIVIANLDTGVSANTVKPMKSISVGSVLMPSYRKDFTDINLCKVHLYLPFIGWTDLPAAEVMSRAPYNDVGVEARPKRLAFKYLVDFVDGNCRCVVSVNGTERWYFDGNCAVDIPLTSDNHTGAISAAIRHGAAALLSVGAAVASYASSNAVGVVGGVLGAAQNAANTVPTYDYHASCSPSGYIEASMNNHIMIIIERPNIKLSDNFAHKVGRPCGLTLNLGSLHGFTKCTEVNLTGVNGTPEELAQIKAALERGVYL